MDSCVTAAIARQTHDLAVLHVSYAQRTERRERQAFDAIADFWGVSDRVAARFEHFAQIGGSALTDSRVAVPEADSSAPVSAEGIPVTYVPFRNAHFLSVAVSWAEVIGASSIFVGAVAEDSSGYPDCRPEYYRVFEELARVGTRPETQIEIVTPVIGMRKSEIVRHWVLRGRVISMRMPPAGLATVAACACGRLPRQVKPILSPIACELRDNRPASVDPQGRAERRFN